MGDVFSFLSQLFIGFYFYILFYIFTHTQKIEIYTSKSIFLLFLTSDADAAACLACCCAWCYRPVCCQFLFVVFHSPCVLLLLIPDNDS